MSFREKDLITGLQQGDKSAFDFLFRSYYTGLCSFARSYLKSSDSSEEIVQDVFVRLWEKHNKILIQTSVKAYLYQSVFNACMNYLKGARASELIHLDIEDSAVRNELMSMDMADSEFTRIFSESAEKELEYAISELPDQCREIFRLCRNENLSYKEISNILNVSKSTVKTQMSRAMEKIMKQMEKFF